ncbi:MAG TPA: aquaporin [Polyangium sp.]|nr:aquaporin [Polyangium sp.]
MRRAWAEGVGTFIVVFAGCGAAAVGGAALGTIGIALAFGLAVAAAALALGPVSGAHLNPAVTVAAALAGRMRSRDVLPYVAAQIAGATAGVGLAVTIARGRPGGAPGVFDALSGGFGRHSPGFYGANAALAAEIGLSAILAFVLLGGADRARPATQHALSAAAGGIGITLVHLVGMPVTGLPAHPARALGAALCAGGVALDQLWVFVLGPLVGGAIAAMALRILFTPEGSSASTRGTAERAR